MKALCSFETTQSLMNADAYAVGRLMFPLPGARFASERDRERERRWV